MLSAEYALLAFTFLNPFLLWGVVLASIPIIVHLLHRRRYQEVEWAAMQFLVQAAQKNSRRIRLEQLLLLIVRILILMLLAFALAQPFFELFQNKLPANQPTLRVIVIDTSYSMGQRRGELPLLDKAKSIANQIIETTRPGDALQLVRISEKPPRAIVQQPAYKIEELLKEIEQLLLTEERGDISATLQTITEMVLKNKAAQKQKKLPRTEIYFISDFQRESWLPASSAQQQRIRHQMQKLAESTHLVLIDLGNASNANLAVSSLTVQEQLLSTRHPVQLQATVRNDGKLKVTGTQVELYIDGRLWKTETINLEPGAILPVDFQVTLDKPGEHFAEVRLPDDLLLIDNHRYISLPVRDELRVLLVNGRPAGEPRETATYFLHKALSPSTFEETWSGFTRPFVISEGELPSTDFSLYDAVVLCDVAQLTLRETEMLEAYTKSGGSIIFSLGENVKADQYNQFLYRNGKGLLPAQLGNNVGEIDSPQKGFLFDSQDLSHPVVKPFKGNPGTGLETTWTYRYTKTELAPNSQTKIALRFTNGDPVILDALYGRGRVLLITTSLDTRWGLWAVQRSFPPMMHEMIKHVVSGKWHDRQRLVNESISEVFSTQSSYLSVNVITPDKKTKKSPVTTNGFPRVLFDQTRQSGIYQLQIGAPLNQTKLFAVNVNPRESLLEKISKKEITEILMTDQQFQYMTNWGKTISISGSTIVHHDGITRWLLIAVLCLLLTEQLMAWRFYWGFLLLYGMVSACFIQQILTRNLYAGIAATLLFGCGFFLLLVHPRRGEGI
ncbi:hypothetical protein MNBD_PLANCTO02-2551 [hydrothermal vent metagenome]|uniref:VWFA domain-containing protein n=1 Tax=hydrothermal vent metagenome TaxID=652676 RepID=A0A3B1DFF3_9ZZZZ